MDQWLNWVRLVVGVLWLIAWLIFSVKTVQANAGKWGEILTTSKRYLVAAWFLVGFMGVVTIGLATLGLLNITLGK